MKTLKSRKPLIVSVDPSSCSKLPFPRVMWADVDPTSKTDPVVIYPTKSEQRGNRPDLKPIRVLVIAIPEDGQAPLQTAIDALNRCCEQGHDLAQRR